MGKYGFGVRNKNGDRLVEFGSKNNLKIANTCFRKDIQLKWTWRSPDSNINNLKINFLKKYAFISYQYKILSKFKIRIEFRGYLTMDWFYRYKEK